MDSATPTRLSALGLKARLALLAGRIALGAIFIDAAYGKLHIDGRWHLGDYQFFFAMTINSYQIPGLPTWLMLWAAHLFPWLELSLGTLLIVGVSLRWTGSAASLLLVFFMALLTRAVVLGLDINCGCGLGPAYVSPSTELLHDSGFLLLALGVTIGAFLSQRQRSVG
jgi:putative oxidoreductase